MQAFWLEFVRNCAMHYTGEANGNPLRLHDSENIDTVRHTGCVAIGNRARGLP